MLNRESNQYTHKFTRNQTLLNYFQGCSPNDISREFS